jgi:hypothetical protein
MKEQILQQYKALMVSLSNLPNDIHAAQSDLNKAKRTAADTKRLLDETETMTVAGAEGSNAEKRKADVAVKLANNQAYQRLMTAYLKEQAEVETLTNEVDMLIRQYGAVSFQARLHAALMTYLGNAGAPVTVLPTDSLDDVVFQSTNNAPRTANGNSYVTAEDAAQIGL